MRSHLRVLGVPVRFDPTFFFLILFFGYLLFLRDDDPNRWAMFLLWIPVVSGAVLAHELGHALTGRAFGLAPFVVLHGLGGLTLFAAEAHRALSHARRVLITLAGPGAGIVIGLVALAIAALGGLDPVGVPARALMILFWVAAGWGALNLLPVLPLDGGQVVATVLDRFFGARGVKAARIGSAAIALVLGGVAAVFGEYFGAVLGAMLAFVNYRAISVDAKRAAAAPSSAASPRDGVALDVGTIEDGFAALADGDLARARRIAEAARPGEGDAVRVAHLVAWTRLLDGDGEGAARALATLPAGVRADALLEGRVRLARGDAAGAIAPLVEALEDRKDEEIAEALGRALSAADRIDALTALLDDEARATALGRDLVSRVVRAIEAPHLLAAAESARDARFG